ncbi:MAG: hypothetical protein M1835_003838 [Candelina submexicana]|nr:MAG: hypothetical protein M1835_003838 [Candelina submexicana]
MPTHRLRLVPAEFQSFTSTPKELNFRASFLSTSTRSPQAFFQTAPLYNQTLSGNRAAAAGSNRTSQLLEDILARIERLEEKAKLNDQKFEAQQEQLQSLLSLSQAGFGLKARSSAFENYVAPIQYHNVTVHGGMPEIDAMCYLGHPPERPLEDISTYVEIYGIKPQEYKSYSQSPHFKRCITWRGTLSLYSSKFTRPPGYRSRLFEKLFEGLRSVVEEAIQSGQDISQCFGPDSSELMDYDRLTNEYYDCEARFLRECYPRGGR